MRSQRNRDLAFISLDNKSSDNYVSDIVCAQPQNIAASFFVLLAIYEISY